MKYLLLVLWLLAPAWAQEPSPSPPTLPPQLWVELSGIRILPLHDLTDLPAADRAELLHSRLERVLREVQLPIQVESHTGEHGTVLTCDNITLITVTGADAQAANVDIPTLASRWAKSLETALQRVARERSGEFLQAALLWTVLLLVIGLVLHAVLRWVALRWFFTPGLSLRVLSWLMIFTIIMWQFPNTRPLANALVTWAVRPLGLLALVVLGALLVGWVASRLVSHYWATVERVQSLSPQPSPRWRQRLHMGRQVSLFVSSALVFVLALVTYLGLLEVNIGAVLAGAGVIGVGLGLAAQDMLKDWMAGINIVLEDQFGAGDIIRSGEHEGMVENFTLRITQLRDMSGSLITVPNSTIRVVRNLSNVWSQVDATIPVAYDTDVRAALKVIEDTARQMRAEMPDVVTDEPQVLGLDDFGEYAIRLRLLLRTAPQQQFPVRRELLLRLREAFQREGIEIPYQQIRVITSSEPEPSPPGKPSPSGR